MAFDSKLRVGTDTLWTRVRPHDPVEEARVGAAIESRLFPSEAKARPFGRYVLLERLGRGGAGVVYAAYDPQLDRNVAIKFLRSRASDGPSLEEQRRRLLAEAQAIAQLNHPHVVSVYDVGTYAAGTGNADSGIVDEDGQSICLVMELVVGQDLHQWLEREPRTTAAIWACFHAAGLGLLAAHESGLVHGDFKPGNVMVGHDGRVKVLDFGLARPVRVRDEQAVDHMHPPSIASKNVTASIAGTPAYLAPEQHYGSNATPLSDQYAFAVALYEGLCGSVPFGAHQLSDLAKSKCEGMPSLPLGHRVPRHVEAALRRALAVDPTTRFPDMAAFLDALHGPRSKHGATIGVSVAAVFLGLSLVGTSTFVSTFDADNTSPGECAVSPIAAPASDINAAVRQQWEAQLASAKAFDLAARYAEADGLLQRVLAQAGEREDATTLAKAELLAGRIQRRQARYERARDHYWQALSWAERACDDSSVLRALQGLLLLAGDDIADPRQAEPLAEYTRARAARAGLDASIEPLIYYAMGRVYERAGDYRRAFDSLAHAERLANSRFDTDDLIVGDILNMLGVAFDRRGEYRRARTYFEQSARHRVRTLGVQHPDTATATANAAIMHSHLGDARRAIVELDAALHTLELALGSEHPLVGWFTASLGYAHEQADQFDVALHYQRRALAIRAHSLGTAHPEYAYSLTDVARVLHALERNTEALPLATQALAITTEHDEQPALARAAAILGQIEQSLGNLVASKAHTDRALQSARSVLGDRHPTTGFVWRNMAKLELAIGNTQAARHAARQAQRIASVHDYDAADVAWTNFVVAETIADSQPYQSRHLAKQALQTLEREGSSDDHRRIIAGFLQHRFPPHEHRDGAR